MKQNKISLILKGYSLALVGLLVISCASLDELANNAYSVTPNPLEVHGGEVTVDMSISIAPRKFNQEQALEITPALIYNNGKDTARFESITFQGEKFTDNFEVIPFNEGKDIQYTGSVEYQEGMNPSNLILLPVSINNTPQQERTALSSFMVATGLITTSTLVQDDDIVLLADDTYQEYEEKTYDSKINFDYNSFYIKKSEVTQSDIKQVQRLIGQAKNTEHVQIKNFNVNSFASPEGGVQLNQKLSENRGTSSQKLVGGFLRKKQMSRDFNFVANGADWKGFMELIELEPSLKPKDKGLIKRSLDDSPLLKTKEKTLRNLMRTYPIIGKKIFPELRRSEVVVNYAEKSRTVEEIKELFGTNPKALNIEELLYAAKLYSELDKKLEVFLKATEIYPKDYRTYNNAGSIYFIQGDFDKAEEFFNKAFEISDNDITKNNIGILSRRNGDIDKAIELLEATTEPKARYNLGLLYLNLGDYEYALENMESTTTNNVILAKILTKDYQGALNLIENEEDEFESDELTYYLEAVAQARQGELEKAKQAIDKALKDENLAKRYPQDLEFAALKMEQISTANPKTETKEMESTPKEASDQGN